VAGFLPFIYVMENSSSKQQVISYIDGVKNGEKKDIGSRKGVLTF
jgi:hypothetical protein